MACCKPQTTNNGRFANSLFSELQQAMGRIAKVLHTKVDDLEVLDTWTFPSLHSFTSYADHPVKTWGLVEGLPFVCIERLHGKGSPGYGLILYECRTQRELKYLQYCTRDPNGWKTSFYICKKGEVAKIIRNCKKMGKLASKNVQPILREGLLEEIVKNSIEFLLNSKKIEKYGVRIKRGILLDGPPGNGKTMACKYIQKLCTDNNINWGVVNASDIEKAFNDNAMEQLFNRYSVTFFDDIDISYLSRKAGKGEIACSILSSMDGMCDASHTIRIFSTNEKIDDLDEAFKRPGRIDKRFIFDKPDWQLRKKLIDSWPDEIVSAIDVEALVDQTDENTFAELEAVRANLVTNFLFGDNTWNLDKALKDLKENSGSFTTKYRKPLGFNPKERSQSGNGNGHHLLAPACPK